MPCALTHEDNIWAVDKGSDMIVRFSPEGRVTMVFGRKKEASDDAKPWTHVNPPLPAVDGQFRQPTDVTWDPQGNIFISDGYINSRVAKYDKNGDWVKQWGEPGAKPGEFSTPHSIAADSKGNIYVADRGNRRIQVFNSDGVFLREITIDVPIPPDSHPWMGNQPTAEAAAKQNGAPWAICITPGPTQYLYASDAFPGRVYKLSLEGQVLGVLGRSWPANQAIRMDPRNGMPVGKRDICSGDPELARSEADSALKPFPVSTDHK